MATTKLLTKSDQKDKLVTMYIRFRHGRDIDLVVPTEFKVYPDYWDNNKQRFKQRITFTDNFTEDDKIDIEDDFMDMKNLVLKEYNSLKGKTPTREWLRGIIYKFHNKKNKGEETLNEYIERFIKEAEAGTRTYDHNRKIEQYKKSTVGTYKGFQYVFNEFQKDKKKVYSFDDINMDFYNDFNKYCIKQDYSPNYMGRSIKTLKTLMHLSKDEGLHNNVSFEVKSFKTIKETVHNEYLTEEEIEKIYNLDLSDDEEMELIRDVFLVGCYTAQRFSDYSRIKEKDITQTSRGTKVIKLVQQKTGEEITIPIKKELDTILKKYDYTLPKTFEQVVNKNIKKIVGKAKITYTVTYQKVVGGKRYDKTTPKNELITTHTARRSGATNMYNAGIPTLDIMKITGHKSERDFLNYIKVTKEQTADNLSKHSWFTSLKKVE